MPRRSKKKAEPLKESNQTTNILQVTNIAVHEISEKGKTQKNSNHQAGDITNIKSILEDENCQPSTSSIVINFNTNTAALYDELDSFRQRWKCELENKQPECLLDKPKSNYHEQARLKDSLIDCKSEDESLYHTNNFVMLNERRDIESSDQTYAKAKKLFLTAVELEQDDMHHESIRYYKQAMHLCPDIEKQIFREQCEASAKETSKESCSKNVAKLDDERPSLNEGNSDSDVPLLERIRQSYYEDCKNQGYTHCRPSFKYKQNTVHISDLPLELILKIFRYVIGEDLDLASLESLGLVCRSFYLLSKDQSIWRSVCFTAWGDATLDKDASVDKRKLSLQQIDWRQMFLERPRVNYDGVYISRTRYIRQGDVGFQDVTYRPFHVVRYYRYFRFFPDQRVLILTTNEEPDKIVPIFRHALHSKHFSPELSILEGTYEFTNTKQISVVAEKDCRASLALSNNQRRQAQFHWSRQTPITQKFKMKFELRTMENKPYHNNVLKWLDYTILTRLETGEEVTSFDLSPETFPNLLFSRVKRFNIRLTNPLSSH